MDNHASHTVFVGNFLCKNRDLSLGKEGESRWHLRLMGSQLAFKQQVFQFFRCGDDVFCAVTREKIRISEPPCDGDAGDAGVFGCFDIHLRVADVEIGRAHV